MRASVAVVLTVLAVLATLVNGNVHTPTVVIMVPISNAFDELPYFMESVENLKYPKSKIALAFLESDSTDDGLTSLWFDMHLYELQSSFARVELHRVDFQYNTDMAASTASEEITRLATLARRRNTLISLSLKDDDDYVLWADVFVRLPSDAITTFIASRAEIASPNVVSPVDGETLNKRSWRRAVASADIVEASNTDPIILTGFESEWTSSSALVALARNRLDLGELRNDAAVDRAATVSLESVGGEVLWVSAEIFRAGGLFPATPYHRFIEAEGFARIAEDLGWTPVGLPNLEVQYDMQSLAMRGSISQFTMLMHDFDLRANGSNSTNATSPPASPTPPNGTNFSTPTATPTGTVTSTGTGSNTPKPLPKPVCDPPCIFGTCMRDTLGAPYCKCPSGDYKQPQCYPCPGTFDPQLPLGACSGRATCAYSSTYKVAYCPNCTTGWVGVACQAKIGPNTVYAVMPAGKQETIPMNQLAVPPHNFFGLGMNFANNLGQPVGFVAQGALVPGTSNPNNNPPNDPNGNPQEGLVGVGLVIDVLLANLNVRVTDLAAHPITIVLDMSTAPLIPGTQLTFYLYNTYTNSWSPACDAPFDFCTLTDPELQTYECIICHATQFNSFAPPNSAGGLAPIGTAGPGAPPPGPVTPPPSRTVAPPFSTSAATVVVVARASACVALALVAMLL